MILRGPWSAASPWCLVLALSAWTGGCGTGPAADVTARDSAGVRIVENRAAAWAEGEAWTVGAPSLDLAAAGSGAAHRFGAVSGALRLGDGRLVVADRGAGEVRYFGADGAALTTRGPDASGAPFGDLASIARLEGDSVLAFDAGREQATVLGPRGDVARVIGLLRPGDLPMAVAHAFRDGSLVVRMGTSTSQIQGRDPGVVRLPLPFLRFSSDGAFADTVVTVPGTAVALVAMGPARSLMPPHLGPVTVSDVHGDELVVGTGETFELRRYAPGGDLLGIVRVPGADLSVSPDELAASREARRQTMRGNPLAEQLLARIEAELPEPASRPAYGALIVDGLGYLWVGEYPWLGPAGPRPRPPQRWTVFEPDGRMLGTVDMPAGLAPMDIGRDYVLGVLGGEGGGGTVTLHPLSR